MSSADTEMGGPDRAFRTTLWTEILAAGGEPDEKSRESLDRLLRAYWKPVFAYVRSSWKVPVEDAKDLTQAFFARFLEKGYFANLQPERGSFRGYLKRALQHFLLNAKRHDDARLPSEGKLFSLDAAPAELEAVAAGPDESPDRAYDREWFATLIDASFDELRRLLEADGKKTWYEMFEAYCLETGDASASLLTDGPSPTYRSIAAKFGVREQDVNNHLAHARRLLREIVRGRIREYSDGESDLERELREVIRG